MPYFSLKSDFKTVKCLNHKLTLKTDLFVKKCIEGLTNSRSEKKIIKILISDWLTSLGREESIGTNGSGVEGSRGEGLGLHGFGSVWLRGRSAALFRFFSLMSLQSCTST